MRKRCVLRIVGAAAAVVLAAAAAEAQQPIGTLQFSFSNPGARSLGFGGAFVALADDATAAFANPAGLVQLVRPEVSIEYRGWSYSTPFVAGGRVSGPPTGIGLDTSAGLRRGTSRNDLSGLSFLSFVYPRGDLSFALYRHQLANFESTTTSEGLFAALPGGALARDVDRRILFELDFVTYGVSAAYRLAEGFDLGLGIAYFDGTMLVASEYHVVPLERFFAPTGFAPESLLATVDLGADSTDWGLLAGVLWQVTPRWTLGAVYREGPDFEIDGEAIAGPRFDPQIPPGTVFDRLSGAPLTIPDVYGLGLAFRSRDERLTASVEWDRVEYSAIVESLDRGDLDADGVIEDADEIHLGLEYAFLRSQPVVAVRVGAWLDPDHSLRNTGPDLFDRALFPGGDDELHLAAGVGLAFHSFQIDLGVDLSDLVDTAALSAIYSF